jgi:hypothetical protein|tara:strand:- start:1379 stop:2209 length:831 start_codon:yes stop_codon:yes gene_type:complete
MKNNSLNNIENYNTELDSNEHILFIKYIGLIHELIECSVDNIFIQKPEYLKYVLMKGIKNVFYIFNFLLLYTKNLELTIYHTQKAILYFIEFIGQIGDDSHSFLKLNTKDASLFIYKKTIFEVNNDFRKSYEESEETKTKMEMLHLYIETYNNIMLKIIENFDFQSKSLEDLQTITFTKLYKIVESLIQLPIIFKSNKENIKEKINEYNTFVNNINICYSMPFICNNYLNLINYTIKKGYKNNIDNSIIKKKLELINIEQQLDDYSICKIYNYITN